jgi:CRISPR-associated protein (TIGR02710 family)
MDATGQQARVLLISVGGSPGQVVCSLLSHRAPRVIYFVSPESRALVREDIRQACAEGQYHPDEEIVLCDDAQSINACTLALMSGVPDALHKLGVSGLSWPDLVDITGGTKCMTAALFWASSRYPCKVSYVGTGQVDARGGGGPGGAEDGMAEVRIADNSLHAVAFYEIRQALHLMGQHHYVQAVEHLCAATGKVSDDWKRLVEVLEKIARGFQAWDIFDHKGALNLLKPLRGANLEDLALRHESIFPGLVGYFQELLESLDFLEASGERGGGKGDAGAAHRARRNRVLDLLANALRRAGEKKYDDATARVYSALEQHTQCLLEQDHGISPSRALPGQIPEGLREDYVGRYGQTLDAGETILQFGLVAGLELLAELGHPAGDWYRANQEPLRASLSMRNASILAHGTVPMDEEKFRGLFEQALALMDLDRSRLDLFPAFGDPGEPGH